VVAGVEYGVLQKLRLLGSLLFAVRLPAEGGDSASQKPPYQPFPVSGPAKISPTHPERGQVRILTERNEQTVDLPRSFRNPAYGTVAGRLFALYVRVSICA
jgi:hypothetical protein